MARFETAIRAASVGVTCAKHAGTGNQMMLADSSQLGRDCRVAACRHCIQYVVKAVHVYWKNCLHQGETMAVLNV